MFTTRRYLALATSALLFASSAAAQEQPQQQQEQQQEQQQQQPVNQAVPEAQEIIPQTTADTLSRLEDFHLSAWIAIEDSGRANISQFASENASDERVKQFAQQQISSHREFLASLRDALTPGDLEEGEDFDFASVLQEMSNRLAVVREQPEVEQAAAVATEPQTQQAEDEQRPARQIVEQLRERRQERQEREGQRDDEDRSDRSERRVRRGDDNEDEGAGRRDRQLRDGEQPREVRRDERRDERRDGDRDRELRREERRDGDRDREELREQRREERRDGDREPRRNREARRDRERVGGDADREPVRQALLVVRDNLPMILDTLGQAIDEGEVENTALTFIELKRQINDALTQQIIEQMQQKETADQVYLAQVIVSGSQLLATLQVASNQASPELKQILDDHVPTVRADIDRARELMAQLQSQ